MVNSTRESRAQSRFDIYFRYFLPTTFAFLAFGQGNNLLFGQSTLSTWSAGAGAWETASNWNPSSFAPNNGAGGLNYDAVISNGSTVSISGSVISIDSLQLSNGGLAGTGTLNLMNQSSIGAGTISGNGSLVVNANAGLVLGGSNLSLSTTINNFGNSVLTTANNINFNNGGRWNNKNGSVLELQNGGGLRLQNSVSSFQNELGASIVKTGAATSIIDVAFINLGTIDVKSGQTRFTNATLNGTQLVSSGASLSLEASTLGNGRSVQGAGRTFLLGENKLSFGSFTFDTDVSLSAAGQILAASTSALDGTINFNKTLDWTGSTGLTATSSGKGTFNAFGAVNISTHSASIGAHFKNHSVTTTIGPNAFLFAGPKGIFENMNGGVVNIVGNHSFLGDANAVFQNNAGGVLNKSGTADTSVFKWQLNNQGVISIQTGTLSLERQGSLIDSIGGTINIANGANLRITNGVAAGVSQTAEYGFVDGLSINGPGNFNVTGNRTMVTVTGNVNINAKTTIGDLVWFQGAGNLNLNAETTIGSVLFRNSAVTPGNVNFNAPTTFTGNVEFRQVMNNNSVVTVGNNFAIVSANQAIWNNNSGSTLLFTGAAGIAGTGSFDNAVFNNHANASLIKTGPSGGAIVMKMNNSGLIDLSSNFGFSEFTQNNGTLLLRNGATASFLTSPTYGPQFNGGRIEGNGTLHMGLSNRPGYINGATISPGLSAGRLDVFGTLVLGADATLEIELGGREQGVTYDFISTNGGSILNGTLNVSFLNGFENSVLNTDVFTIFTGISGGQFLGLSSGSMITTSDNKGRFWVYYGAGSPYAPNSVVLTGFIVAVPEPSALCLVSLCAASLIVRRRSGSRAGA